MIEKAFEYGFWPLAFIICVFGFFLIFRSPIGKLILSVRKASHGETSIEWSGDPKTTAEQQKEAGVSVTKPTLPMVPASATLPAPSDVHSPIEQEIRTVLNNSNLPTEVHREWLIRGLAVARVERAHEVVYRLIFGSQLDLLVAANSLSPPDTASAAQIYERAKTAFPDFYGKFSFEMWLHFPISMGLLAHTPPIIRITPPRTRLLALSCRQLTNQSEAVLKSGGASYGRAEDTPGHCCIRISIAAFLLSAATLHASVKRGDIDLEEASKIISDARTALDLPGFFVGDERAREIADYALGVAQSQLREASFQMPRSVPS
jgi:hypothetical protein